ncbi:Rieske 2Fe-2S domain-containing protein [Acinetobacter sp. CFCC 11171]|uniref:Rieske 2Fe-2S domain-containing protein n=1 Tax=Acinetobacter sp. CFCC 11171 TaxID=1775558 RepID=UPI000DCF9508|nr:Rieske 2Fe-2S domain-containing protein [Acinetobacter sp. CFCC 11171]
MCNQTRFWDDAKGLLEEWYVACTSKELKKDQPFSAILYGKKFVLFRQKDGTAAALLDQCVHRGVPLSKGKMTDGCVTCPYHGWSYQGDGHVAHIPSVNGQFFPEKPHPFKQRSFDVCEQDGVVWIYLGEKPKQERPEIFKLPFYDQAGWVSYYMVGSYDGEMGAVAQNIMDVTHTIFVHEGWFRSESGKAVDATIDVGPRKVVVDYHDHDADVGMMPWLTNPHGAEQVHRDSFIAPNITLVEYHWGEPSGMVFNSLISPVGPYESRVYTCVSYKFPIPKLLSKALMPAVNAYTWVVNKQDIKILSARRAGIEHMPMTHSHSVRGDMAHIALEKILDALRHDQQLAPSFIGKRPMQFQI